MLTTPFLRQVSISFIFLSTLIACQDNDEHNNQETPHNKQTPDAHDRVATPEKPTTPDLFKKSSQTINHQKANTMSPSSNISTQLSLEEANTLIQLPLHCITVEYPNKLNNVLNSDQELASPKTLHPAFYGCFDWHSSVHGHWSLVSLLKQFPNADNADLAKEKLRLNISKENILKEIAYFNIPNNTNYERAYGWAWLLKLAEELHTWDDPLARQLENNLQPLTDLIVEKYLQYLPVLHYPIRVGEHTNTAFALSFAWDYAKTTHHTTLKTAIEQRAKDFFLKDKHCPINWEPSGYDFLSPCLEEIDIMRRVLSKDTFALWIEQFLPELKDKHFTMDTGIVSDRSDGKLVHLDGVNFSRAWCLYGLANQYPEFQHLVALADKHIAYSLPNLIGDHYEGGHWLGSFAIYALNQKP